MLGEDSMQTTFNSLLEKYQDRVKKQVPNAHLVNDRDSPNAQEQYITLEASNRSITLKYPSEYKEPIGIDALFSLHDSQKLYAMYLTDIDDETLQDTFNDLTSNAVNFLQGHYRTLKRKGLLGRAWEYIDIDSPETTPSTANLIESGNK